MSEPYYDSKSVEVQSAEYLNNKDQGKVLALILAQLGKEAVKTIYFCHGDEPIEEFTIADVNTTKTGHFDRE